MNNLFSHTKVAPATSCVSVVDVACHLVVGFLPPSMYAVISSIIIDACADAVVDAICLTLYAKKLTAPIVASNSLTLCNSSYLL